MIETEYYGDSDHVSLISLDTRSALYELLQKGVLTDVTLHVADGTQFNAHRIILATSSGYFRALFTTGVGTEKHCDTKLPNVTPEVMRILIDFMYMRQLDVTEGNVRHVMITADFLAVDAAVALCSSYLIYMLQPKNCIGIYKFGRQYNYQYVVEESFLYICKHFSDIIYPESELIELDLEDFNLFIADDRVNVKNEETIWKAVVMWVSNDAARSKHIASLLQNVRLGLLEPNFFLDNVKDNEIVIASEDCMSILKEAERLLFEFVLPTELPHPRLPHEILLAIGGWAGGSPTSVIEAYDVRADCWTLIAERDPAGPRAYHGVAVHGNEIFVIGGYNGIEYYNACRCFNVVDKTWREIAPMHKTRCYVSVAVWDSYIYAMGGYNGTRRQSSAERYDIQANQWSMIADMNFPRSDASASALEGKIYMVGGFNGQDCLSSVEVYDPNLGFWTLVRSMSHRRSGVSCTTYNDHLYVAGGFDGQSRLSTGEMYNPILNTWTEIPEMISLRSNFALGVIDGLLTAVGGFNGHTTTANVEILSTETNEWKPVRPLNIGRSALQVCIVKELPVVRSYLSENRNCFLISRRERQLQGPVEEPVELELDLSLPVQNNGGYNLRRLRRGRPRTVRHFLT